MQINCDNDIQVRKRLQRIFAKKKDEGNKEIKTRSNNSILFCELQRLEYF